jgi:ribosome assembly protein 1
MRGNGHSNLQVAIEPALPRELPLLEAGLRLLNRADPFVRVTLSEDTGEWILGAAGEIHLETCVNDLQSRFARIALTVSPPLVSFKESVVHPAEVPLDAVAGVVNKWVVM